MIYNRHLATCVVCIMIRIREQTHADWFAFVMQLTTAKVVRLHTKITVHRAYIMGVHMGCTNVHQMCNLGAYDRGVHHGCTLWVYDRGVHQERISEVYIKDVQQRSTSGHTLWRYIIAETYRPDSGVEPRVSRLTYERSTN